MYYCITVELNIQHSVYNKLFCSASLSLLKYQLLFLCLFCAINWNQLTVTLRGEFSWLSRNLNPVLQCPSLSLHPRQHIGNCAVIFRCHQIASKLQWPFKPPEGPIINRPAKDLQIKAYGFPYWVNHLYSWGYSWGSLKLALLNGEATHCQTPAPATEGVTQASYPYKPTLSVC